MQVAGEQNSTTQTINCLRARLGAAEHRLEAVRDTAESSQEEVKRDHAESRHLF